MSNRPRPRLPTSTASDCRSLDLDDGADAGDLAGFGVINLDRAAVKDRALQIAANFMLGRRTSMPNSGWPG
jgi:hypothetical protein